MSAATEPVQEMQLSPAGTDPFFSLIERLAVDDRIDVEKLGKILDLQRGLRADQAKAEYQAAFAAMSEKLPIIAAKGEIKNRDGKVQSTFARYEDIQKAIKPILREFGFTLNHEQHPETGSEMILTTFLIHRGGHSQKSTFRSKQDDSGSKNHVQGLGSIASYAKRYNTIALLDLETHGEDDDAQSAVPVPEGFKKWLDALYVAAKKGTKTLTAAWECSEKEMKAAILVKDWEAIKAEAKRADRG